MISYNNYRGEGQGLTFSNLYTKKKIAFNIQLFAYKEVTNPYKINPVNKKNYNVKFDTIRSTHIEYSNWVTLIRDNNGSAYAGFHYCGYMTFPSNIIYLVILDQNDNPDTSFEYEGQERIEELLSEYPTREIHIYSSKFAIGTKDRRNDNNPTMINYIYTSLSNTKLRLKYEVVD